MPRRSILLFAGACIVIAVALAIVTLVVVSGRERAAGGEMAATGQPLVGGDFQLVDQEGRPVDQTILNGKWSLVFFGFTYCPEFCPTTLAEMAAVQQQLGEQVGVRFQQIQKYERGTNRISAASLARIAVVLDTTASELMGETFATDLPGARSLLTSWSKLTPEQRAAVVNLMRSFTR